MKIVYLIGIFLSSTCSALDVTFPTDCPRIREGSLNHTFGLVRNGGTRNHQGWDFGGNKGDRIVAISNGKIHSIGVKKNYGKYILLEAKSNAIYFFYAHLDVITVSSGDKVKKGDVIGKMGNTGNAINTPYHVHVEYRTTPWPSLGLEGRKSLFEIFEVEFHYLLRDKYPCDN
uniref:M23ase beta-sheet core domain-containing protein n=1 Tax=viral metagenome TaxID=1070528 RepID=A0A2V0RA85_9ZZZZ